MAISSDNLRSIHIYGLLIMLAGLAFYGKYTNDFQDWPIKPNDYKNFLYWSLAGFSIAFLGALGALFTSFKSHRMIQLGSSAIIAAGLVCISVGAFTFMNKINDGYTTVFTLWLMTLFGGGGEVLCNVLG